MIIRFLLSIYLLLLSTLLLAQHTKTFVNDSIGILDGKAQEDWTQRPNRIGIAVNELVNSAIAIRYLRQVNNRHLLGAFISVFPLSKGTDVYNGFKFSPAYQFNLDANPKRGAYLEAKISMGYYSCDRISYSWENHTEYQAAKFWTYGGSAALGFRWSVKEKVLFSYSVGYQYLPAGFPNSITINGRDYHQGAPGFGILKAWPVAGPGAVVEMKFIIGFNF